MHKKFIAGVVAVAVIFPVFALAETSAAQTQILSLMSQIQALQQQLKAVMEAQGFGMGMMGTSSREMRGGDLPDNQVDDTMRPPMRRCIFLNRDLKVGAKGDDVTKLQEMLANDSGSGFKGKATGLFGPMTANAIAKIQIKFGIASSTDGRVGPATRAFFQGECKKTNQGQGEGRNDDPNEGRRANNRGDDPDMRGDMTDGMITSSNATSITVQTPGGETKTATINATTVIIILSGTSTPPTTGTVADLIVGKKATISVMKARDGTLTAMRIMVGNVPRIRRMD